ncbi:MAG: hypothetical protein IJH25_09795 [Clostridia bacterium]|nr:hypothetical protein [Clostridia bacterium]
MNMRKILNAGLLLVSIGGIAVSVANLIPYIREEAQSASLYAELAAIHVAGDAESVATAMPVVSSAPMEMTADNENTEGIDSEDESTVEMEATPPPSSTPACWRYMRGIPTAWRGSPLRERSSIIP